jgi:hybrid cluster-associated redox disulfide protein
MHHPHLHDPDLSLADIMTIWPATIAVFLQHKMLCVGCFIGPFHTVGDACAHYELNTTEFYTELTASITAVPLTPEQAGEDHTP